MDLRDLLYVILISLIVVSNLDVYMKVLLILILYFMNKKDYDKKN